MISSENVIEINQAEFNDKVIEASTSVLVLVDFWAPWCGPCKQLTPLLEKVVNNSKGKVKLAKLNIDDNQQIASQLRIQSIPAVFAFKDGQPVNAFQGVIPEKKIIEFIEKCLGEKIEEDFTKFYDEMSSHISNDEFEKAKEKLEVFISANPNEYKAFSLYIDSLVGLKEYDEADVFCKSLNKDAVNDKFIRASLQKFSIIKNNKEGPKLSELISNYHKNPNKIENIIKLADKYFSENMHDDAFDLLLLNYKTNKELIKKKFIEFFDALGSDNEKTIVYRKKLSSIMFV